MLIYENKEQAYYLRRFAALQFPGSVENYSTRNPIHLLQQRSSDRDNDKRFWDAYIDGELDGAYFTHEDFAGEHFENLNDLVMSCLEIYDEDAIERYNDDCSITGNKPFEQLVPGEDEYEYLQKYGIDVDAVTAWIQADSWDTMAIGFTHDEVDHQRELLDNHITEEDRTYAMAPTSYGRENEEVACIMDFIRNAGEELLSEDLRNYDFRNLRIKSPEEVIEHFRKSPDSKFMSVSFRVHDKVNDIDYKVKVTTAGKMQQLRDASEIAIIKPDSRYLEVTKTDHGVATVQKFPYPFEHDHANEVFFSGNDGFLTAVNRLFLYTLYKKPLSSERVPSGKAAPKDN